MKNLLKANLSILLVVLLCFSTNTSALAFSNNKVVDELFEEEALDSSVWDNFDEIMKDI